jgi:hypothetical protein
MKTQKNIKKRKKKVVMLLLLLLLFACSAKYEIDGHPSGRPPMHTRTLSHITCTDCNPPTINGIEKNMKSEMPLFS